MLPFRHGKAGARVGPRRGRRRGLCQTSSALTGGQAAASLLDVNFFAPRKDLSSVGPISWGLGRWSPKWPVRERRLLVVRSGACCSLPSCPPQSGLKRARPAPERGFSSSPLRLRPAIVPAAPPEGQGAFPPSRLAPHAWQIRQPQKSRSSLVLPGGELLSWVKTEALLLLPLSLSP